MTRLIDGDARSDTGSVVTVGTFDGVHLGHRAIFGQLQKVSRERGLQSVVVIFEPQPSEYFDPKRAPARLTSLRNKLEALQSSQIDKVVCLRFNEQLRSLSAKGFVEEILLKGLNAKHIIVGDDFRFGQNREGDFRFLRLCGAERGFSVEDTPTFKLNGLRVSSTRIRESLQNGDIEQAASLLGRAYGVLARVQYGQQLGRKIGFPTMNIAMGKGGLPLSGVFAVEGKVAHTKHLAQKDFESWERFEGMANIGFRPTVDSQGDSTKQPVLEVHAFDFDRNVYGHCIQVSFIKKLRQEIKFDGMEALQRQLKQDATAAQEALQMHRQN